jgi:CheY-like chemotaxis protein
MDRDTLKRVFDPFFTTKGPDRGTGLGLAMAFGLMKLHSGFINIDSHKGAGTTVHLLFPATEVAVPGSADAPENTVGVQWPEQASSAARKPIALTVEDNRPLRRAGKRILEAEGYEVLEAGDGVEALEIFGAHRGKIAVVVSDLMMPRMGGAELYRRLMNEYGPVPFVVSSGHVDEAAELHDDLPKGVPYILKPWTAQDLVRAVREATAAGREP